MCLESYQVNPTPSGKHTHGDTFNCRCPQIGATRTTSNWTVVMSKRLLTSRTTSGFYTRLLHSSIGLNSPIQTEMEPTLTPIIRPLAYSDKDNDQDRIQRDRVFALEGPVSYGGGKFPVYS